MIAGEFLFCKEKSGLFLDFPGNKQIFANILFLINLGGFSEEYNVKFP